MAAVDEVLRIIRPAAGARLKMVDCQLRSHLLLMDAAVAAPEAKALPHLLPLLGGHPGVAPETASLLLRIRASSSSIASSSAFASARTC